MKLTILAFVSSLLFPGVFADAVPEPLITPAPVAPRQFLSDIAGPFIGYYSTLGTFVAGYCPDGYTMSYSDEYAGCCVFGDSSCEFVTRCKDNTVFGGGIMTTCPYPAATCNTNYILVSSGEAFGWYWLGCSTETEIVFYQMSPSEAPASTTSVDAILPISHAVTLSTSASEPTSTDPSTISADASSTENTLLSADPTSTAAIAPSKNHKAKKSLAWIAAAVIVPLFLLAALGGLLFFLIRRKRNKPNPYTQQSEYLGPSPPYAQQSQYLGPSPPPFSAPAPAPPATPVLYAPRPQHPPQSQSYNMGMVSPQSSYASPVSPMPTSRTPLQSGSVSPVSEPLEPAPAYTHKGAQVYQHQFAPVGDGKVE